MAKLSTRRTNPGRARGAPGASARKKPGTPMVNVEISVRCLGKNGYPAPAMPITTAITDAYPVLVTNSRDPVDVGDDPPAFGQYLRYRCERAVEPHHNPGIRPAGVAARAHLDAQIGLLQRLPVVAPIADHRDHVPGLPQRAHRGQLLARSHPAEHANRADPVGHLGFGEPGSVGR